LPLFSERCRPLLWGGDGELSSIKDCGFYHKGFELEIAATHRKIQVSSNDD
jgi:hypothetical protein